MDADELVQIAERMLFDAEEAYRLDPSSANQRRVMKAWTAVRRARERQRDDPVDAAEAPAAPDG
ncbi:MAG TPA: hypothetical protein VME22_21900 [Solirubrobacteraceae bacterium]|nr:hypothetical protein [Solirubrobacteraceae bacterium]